MKRQLVIVVDFGGQYNQLIARRVRENNVYCEIVPYTYSIDKIKQKSPDGIIFTGGPKSVYGKNAPKISSDIFKLGVPILGICYGHQFICSNLGGKVESAVVREYGKTKVSLDSSSPLFSGIDREGISWMSHTDVVSDAPEGFKVIGTTDECPVAAVEDSERKIYGVQFHPEVEHTPFGKNMISNFLSNI